VVKSDQGELTEEPETAKLRREREFTQRAELLTQFLAEGPKTRREIGDWAESVGISPAQLGELKSRLAIVHIRVEQGTSNGEGRKVFAWCLKGTL
jgi:hypothetical protein